MKLISGIVKNYLSNSWKRSHIDETERSTEFGREDIHQSEENAIIGVSDSSINELESSNEVGPKSIDDGGNIIHTEADF
jgi:hypothetical protein